MSYKKFYLNAALVLVITLLITECADAAHAVCGKVNNAEDGTDAAWRSVIIYYSEDKGNNVSCDVGPENNKYCCDSEGFNPPKNWKIGNIIFAEVVDAGDGYIAGSVSMAMTGAGYDVLPEMTLGKAGASVLSSSAASSEASSEISGYSAEQTNSSVSNSEDNVKLTGMSAAAIIEKNKTPLISIVLISALVICIKIFKRKKVE